MAAARPEGWEVVGYWSDPVPGDRWEISSLARSYKRIGDAAGEASSMLTTIRSSGGVEGWDSDAGDVFIDKIEDLPKDLEKAATSYSALYEVLDSWSGSVEETQHRADAALEDAKSAKDDLDAASSRLADARADYQSYDVAYSGLKKDFDKCKDDEDAPADAPKDYQVSAAANNRSVAAGRVSDAEGDVEDANERIAAAKKLVKEAHGDWEDAEESTAKRIGEAADAGLGKQHWWDKVFGSEIWDTLIEICKVIVAIGGIIVLIIGGPLAWVVFAAALLVLADTLYKMSQGTAGFGDLIFALIDCIPGTKGITTLARLGAAATDGMTMSAKVIAVGAQFLSDAKGVVKGMGLMVQNVFKGGLSGQLAHMKAVLVHGARGPVDALFTSIRNGDGFGATITSVVNGSSNAIDAYKAGLTNPVDLARMWQGGVKGGYLGVDDWKLGNGSLSGTFESGYPGTSPFSVPANTMAPGGVAGDAASHYGNLQVGPTSAYPNLRSEGITWTPSGAGDVPYAYSDAVANPQFGPGGGSQFFVPNFGDHVANGNITVLDNVGSPIPVSDLTISGDVVNIASHVPNSTLPMSNLTPGPGVWAGDWYGHTIQSIPNVVGGAATAPWDFSEMVASGSGTTDK